MSVRFEPLEGDAKRHELARLEALPRRVPTVTRLLGRALEIPDARSFLWTVPDVVERGVYDFPADGTSPRILDGGANVGLASLYWKSRWPAARIVAFEPDEAIFGMLRRNLATWGAGDVECVRAALWSRETELDFLANGADGGRVVAPGEPANARVPAVRMRDLLAEPFDLVKLDVEGAERELLADCADCLAGARHFAVEWHSFGGRPQELDEILAILRHAGFRIVVEGAERARHPLHPPPDSNGKDGYVQVFARRAG